MQCLFRLLALGDVENSAIKVLDFSIASQDALALLINPVYFPLHIDNSVLKGKLLGLVKGLDEKDSRLRQSVSTEIIEWEMGKAMQKVEHGGDDLVFRVVHERDWDDTPEGTA